MHMIANIDGKLTTINSNITNKQATLSAGTIATNSQAVLSGSIIKNIIPGTGTSIVSDANNITINSTDTYTKTEILQQMSDLIKWCTRNYEHIKRNSKCHWK